MNPAPLPKVRIRDGLSREPSRNSIRNTRIQPSRETKPANIFQLNLATLGLFRRDQQLVGYQPDHEQELALRRACLAGMQRLLQLLSLKHHTATNDGHVDASLFQFVIRRREDVP